MIINLRPGRYRSSFHHAFRGFGLTIVDCEMLHPEPVLVGPVVPDDYDLLILTSPMATDFLPDRAALRRLPILAVGAATAAAARQVGFADVQAAAGDARSLADVFAASPYKRALYLSAQEPACDLETRFPGRVHRRAIYRMVERTEVPDTVASAIESADRILIPIYSRRTGVAFAAAAARSGLMHALAARATAVGISRRTTTITAPPWRQVVIAEAPTEAAIVAAAQRVMPAIPSRSSAL